ncbi:RabGAP/TBC [Obba rivulosa]|uniref:RabGAP/TBC n=1 Tax=Obba rivulosa TaxID=1052685 RepID=A0A8E2DVQ8_9APHY|nr:RabGAP/TBC [Obba rivulosa]
MAEQHSGDEPPDNEHHPNTLEATLSRLSLDDAFDDADDHDVSLEFSPSAIRAALSKNLNGGEDWHPGLDNASIDSAKVGYSVDPDASVSTFDIDARSPPTLERTFSSESMDRPQLTHYDSAQDSLYDVPLSESVSQASVSSQLSSPPAPPSHPNGRDHVSEFPSVQIHTSDDTPVVAEVKSEPALGGDTSLGRTQQSVSHEEVRARNPLSLSSPLRASANAVSTSSLPLPTSQSLPVPSTSEPPAHPPSNAPRHRPARPMGPSALDKVVSKTRPSFLPPKDRSEDKKHMADWEKMMKHSRVAEEKRRKALHERRLARERKIEESISVWEREIVPDWTVVHRNHALRKLWWQGIPTKLRATMWQNAVGNSLVLGKDTYKTCLSRAKRALSSGTFPTTILRMLEEDIACTLPALHLFAPETGPLYQDLKDMLCAWVVSRSDEGLGYVSGIAKVAAMILINMAPAPGFVLMRNLLERHCLRSFYGGLASKDEVEAYYRIFDTLLADGMPKIYFNFKQHQISPAAYLPEWIIPLFLDHLPFEACARLWDILLLEGDSFLYRAALAILAVLEPRLFFPDRRELLELLKGENKAALEVARRESRPLDGGKYEIYGVDEETLWERLDAMDEWWKPSTWTRLIQRELPDL